MVARRRMVRNYDPDRPVPREVLSDIVELGLHAPSAGFSQGWRFLVLDDAASLERYWAATTGPGEPDGWLIAMRRAPALIVAFSDKDAYLERYAQSDKGWTDRDEARWPVPYWDIDTGMACLLMLLDVVDRGLGACFFGVPAEHWPALGEAFEVPAGLTPVGAISVGYRAPDRPSPARGRRPVSEVAVYGSFGG